MYRGEKEKLKTQRNGKERRRKKTKRAIENK
jgi:hypothetical protein